MVHTRQALRTTEPRRDVVTRHTRTESEATGEGVTAADPAAPRRERKALNRLTKKEASLSLSHTHTIVPTPTFPHMRQCHLSPLRQTHSLTHDALNPHSSFQLDNL